MTTLWCGNAFVYIVTIHWPWAGGVGTRCILNLLFVRHAHGPEHGLVAVSEN